TVGPPGAKPARAQSRETIEQERRGRPGEPLPHRLGQPPERCSNVGSHRRVTESQFQSIRKTRLCRQNVKWCPYILAPFGRLVQRARASPPPRPSSRALGP